MRSAAVAAALVGVYAYAGSQQAQFARSAVSAANVAHDCEPASACRVSQGADGRIVDGQDSMLDALGSVPRSICMLRDDVGEAAAAGDAMIARAYKGGVVQD